MPIRAVNVEGIDRLVRDLRKIDKSLARDLQGKLKELAEPVADEVRSLSSRYGSRTSRGIKIGIRGSTVVVRQSIGGKRVRPKFGSLLFRTAFIPAVEDRQAEVVDGVEKFLEQLFAEDSL